MPAPKIPVGSAEVHDMWCPEVGDTYRIFVGECGEQPEVTIFGSDGNGLFGLTVDTVRLMQIPALLPPMLVVGIGYPHADTIDDTSSIRTRDLTPTRWHTDPHSGGADRFLAFIGGDLSAWLAERYPLCLTSTMYFGHSLGGLFGVHALLGDGPAFDYYIISSPSLFWDRYAVFAGEQRRAVAGKDLTAHAFFGIGALETDAGRRLEGRDLPDGHIRKPPATHLDMVDDMIRFTDALRSRAYPGLDLQVVVYPDEYHATVPGVVLSHGLRRFFSGR